MREQPHYTDLLTEEFFMKYYVEKRMSYPKIREMLSKQGYNIHVGTLYQYAKKLGIGRNRSEAKRNWDPDPLDYEISLMTESTLEAIDGFLLGDGHVSIDKGSNTKVARLTCGLEYEEFCQYLMSPFYRYKPYIKEYKHAKMSSGIIWNGKTKTHPDLYIQRQRWYPNNKKQSPNDIRITPKSVMMWYLGDGSLVQGKNTIVIRLSTDDFTLEKVEFLVEKLKEKGIQCHRNNENRIQVDAKGIPGFFEFIGNKSPVKCYDYKFNIPEWRFTAKRMKDVANELGVSYNRLSYFVKTGRIPCLRASEKGRPRMLPEHIDKVRELMKVGEI